MKKTLAIVLALVMVLAMIPAMSAHTTKYQTITDKSYEMAVISVGNEDGVDAAYVAEGNKITFEYDWNKIKPDFTDRYTADVAQAEVHVKGWEEIFNTGADTVTIDGKVYAKGMTSNTLVFPVEVTEAGYSDTFVITLTKTVDDTLYTETAKISVVLKNIGLDLKEKTAVVTNIAAVEGKLSAYIVGDKIYLDYVNNKGGAKIKLTFGDENGKAFTGRVYAKEPTVNGGAICLDDADQDILLDKSAAVYYVSGAEVTDTQFVLDPAYDTKYYTKKYDIVVRENIQEEDPKGIYFAEATKTIAMGESFAPVVVGVKTGKPVAADIIIPSRTDAEVIDVENNVVIGTREGVAFITASYKPNCFGADEKPYKAASMKIIVTLPGESIPEVEPAAEIYYVTCRNLNVRAGAGTSYKKVDMIHRGDAVKVLEIKNGWAKVADGTYVCAKYIAK